MKYIIPVSFFFLFLCADLAAQENPFMEMAGKRYADYTNLLWEEYTKFYYMDTLAAQVVIGQVEDVARKTGSTEWKLRADYLKLELLGRNQKLVEEEPLFAEKLLINAFELLENMKKANLPQLELLLRQKIIDYYWIYFQNYELAFEQYAIQYERLEAISSEDIPEKMEYYVFMTNAYYWFKDYTKAIVLYKKILEEKDYVYNHSAKQHARNGLGLVYAAKNELDSSDFYFSSIIQTQPLNPLNELRRELWNGIAKGNLGNNMINRKEYDKAIPLLKSSIEKIKNQDYPFATGPAVRLADIYLRKNNLAEAKRYIDLATEYNSKAEIPRNLHLFYEVLHKYYAAIGNNEMSMTYMDSMLGCIKQHEEQFNAIVLLRLEQKEVSKQQQQLAQEKEKQRQMQLRLLMLSVGFVFIVSLLGLVLFFYHKKKAAYQQLVRKSQEWAEVKTVNLEQSVVAENENERQSLTPDETDKTIMTEIEKCMTEDKPYTDASLTLESLAQKLNIKSYKVSDAINLCANKNFTSFINEYRIKEAIRLLSKVDDKMFSLDYIASGSGFNDRVNFYRVFKKITGLSPSEFKKTVGSG